MVRDGPRSQPMWALLGTGSAYTANVMSCCLTVSRPGGRPPPRLPPSRCHGSPVNRSAPAPTLAARPEAPRPCSDTDAVPGADVQLHRDLPAFPIVQCDAPVVQADHVGRCPATRRSVSNGSGSAATRASRMRCRAPTTSRPTGDAPVLGLADPLAAALPAVVEHLGRVGMTPDQQRG